MGDVFDSVRILRKTKGDSIMTIEDHHKKIDEICKAIANNTHWLFDAGVRDGRITPEMLEDDTYKLSKMLTHDYLATAPYAPFSKETKELYEHIRRYTPCQ